MALRARLPAAAPTRRAAWVLAGLVTALAALTAIVAGGTVTRLDQYSVDHLMPWLVPGASSGNTTSGFYRPFALHTSNWSKLLDVWTYPCSVLISGLVVSWAGVVLWRRYGPEVAVLPATAWVIANGIEVIGKHVITRPALSRGVDGVRVHITAFDDSFPSGHMARGVVVAFAIALMFPRATRWVALWALLVAPALVISAAHTVTDVVGGLLVGLILVVLSLGVLRENDVRLGRG